MPQEDSGERRPLNKFKAAKIEGPGWDVPKGKCQQSQERSQRVASQSIRMHNKGKLNSDREESSKTGFLVAKKPDLHKTNHRISSKACWYNRKSPETIIKPL